MTVVPAGTGKEVPVASGRSRGSSTSSSRKLTLSSSLTRPLREEIVDELRYAIVTGDLEPNQRLVEEDLARTFEISRGPVREALRQLEQEGLVESTPHRGTAVLDISEAEISEVVIPIRIILETSAFLSVQGRLRPADVAKLQDCIDNMRVGDPREVADADMLFHRTVMERARKPHTLQIWQTISPRVRAFFTRHGQSADAAQSADEHQQLLDALCGTDPDLLRRTIREHIAVL
jgi:DNA-binding GntR family transcriptional regulator